MVQLGLGMLLTEQHRLRNEYQAPTAAPFGPVLSFSIDFAKVVQLHDVTTDTVSPSGNALGLDDFTVDAYDDLFRSLGTLNLSLRTLAGGGPVVAATLP